MVFVGGVFASKIMRSFVCGRCGCYIRSGYANAGVGTCCAGNDLGKAGYCELMHAGNENTADTVLLAGLRRGERRALAKAITLVEQQRCLNIRRVQRI